MANRATRNGNAQGRMKGREERWCHYQTYRRKYKNIVAQKVCPQKEQG